MKGKNTCHINFRLKRGREPAERGASHHESKGPDGVLGGYVAGRQGWGLGCEGRARRIGMGGWRCRKLLQVTLKTAMGQEPKRPVEVKWLRQASEANLCIPTPRVFSELS